MRFSKKDTRNLLKLNTEYCDGETAFYLENPFNQHECRSSSGQYATPYSWKSDHLIRQPRYH
ncbi:MAG: hypothetical protein IJT27_00030 [Clostridia bacterium]|nr:hypothetical protein [Clostridia bacterium]